MDHKLFACMMERVSWIRLWDWKRGRDGSSLEVKLGTGHVGESSLPTRLELLEGYQGCGATNRVAVQSQCATWIVPTPASYPVLTSSSIIVNIPMRGSIATSVLQEETFDIGAGQASIGGRGSCLSTRAPPNIWSRFEFSSPLSFDTHTRSNSTIVFPFITAPPTTCRLYSSSILFRRLPSPAQPQQPCSSLGGLSPNSDLH